LDFEAVARKQKAKGSTPEYYERLTAGYDGVGRLLNGMIRVPEQFIPSKL